MSVEPPAPKTRKAMAVDSGSRKLAGWAADDSLPAPQESPAAAAAKEQPRLTLRAEITSIRRIEWVVLACLALAALGSLAIGVRRALVESQDLQWGGAFLLAHHVDPWAEAIGGYPRHMANFSPPNYLHHLYVILLPMSLVSFGTAALLWCALNLLLSIGTVFLLRRIYDLPAFLAAVSLCLLWMSSPFRVMLAAGQMTMVELFCFALIFSGLPTAVRGVAFGISLAKYSFAPPTLLLFLLRGRIRLLLIAAVLPLLGLAGALLLTATPLRQLVIEPLALAGRAVWPGLADVMTLTETGLRHSMPRSSAQHAAYAVALLGSAGYALLLRRYRLTRGAEFALLAVASLFLFKHLVYDYVFLLVPLSLALSSAGRAVRVPVVAVVSIFWFLASVLNRSTDLLTGQVHWARLVINDLLLAAFLAYLTTKLLHSAKLHHSAGVVAQSGT